jgi:hypothetical protein
MSYTGPHLMTLLGGKKSRQRPTSHGLPFHNVDPSNARFVKSRRRVLYVEDTVGQFPLDEWYFGNIIDASCRASCRISETNSW